MKAVFVYVTVSNADEAEKIGRGLLEDKLVACVNIIDGVRSLYWWKGELQSDAEAVLVAKTREDLTARVIDRAKALHSYDVPCVVTLPILDGNPDFLKWIEEETTT